MADPGRLSVLVTHADGRTSRWAGDEINAENVPASISFGSASPSGFKTASLTLPRRLDRDYADEALYDDIKILGPGGEVAWEGRVAELPREQGAGQSVQVNCVGYAAHLKDDSSFREIYVDRDLSRWGPASVTRRINNIASSYTTHDASVVQDPTGGEPALETGMVGAWAAGGVPTCEPLYDAGGIEIGSLYYAWKRDGSANVGAGPDAWEWQAFLGTSDTFGTNNASGDLQAAGPGTGTLTASGDAKKYGMVRLIWTGGAAGGDGIPYRIFWTCLAVYGAHGLSLAGTASATEAQGVVASEVIEDVIQRAAPLLNVTSDSITPTSFAIPQLAFHDPTTPEDVILRVNAFHQYRWFVWENRTFHYRPSDDSLVWRVRLDQGASLSLEGDSGSELYNGVVVRYTEPDGKQKIVGPTGMTTADATSDDLLDTRETNPVNAHGISRRWAILDLSTQTTQAGATAVGAAWLQEKLLPPRRGQITVRGLIDHATEGAVPVWRVRAGEFISVADRPGDTPREITEVNYDHSSRTATISVGRTFQLDAILERIAVVTGVVT